MSKIVLVETVSMFRHVYAVELNDDEPNEYALDDVTCGMYNSEKLEDFAQQHISEDIFSHRVVTEEEYIQLFDEMNDYLKEWSPEQKKKFIYKRNEEEDRIKEVNKKAYQQVKSSAEFMCVDTSTWKDPE